jgi:exosortase
VISYLPVLKHLLRQWTNDENGSRILRSGDRRFHRLAAARRLMALKLRPSQWGLVLVGVSGLFLIVATLGAELFTARLSFVFTLIGVVWALGGSILLRKLAFPLFLLFFMVPIPAVIYNKITFPLQIIASQLADGALNLLNVPVIREGNVLELANQKLNVVEACSGIRSLLSLTFLALVYGYFFEKKTWIRTVLFFSTIPIAIVANGSRVTITALVTQIKAELRKVFHERRAG